MYDRWSLDVLYKGLDDPKFAEDRKTLTVMIDEMNALADEWEKNPGADRREMTKKVLELREKGELLIYDLLGYLGLRQAADTRDTEVAGMQGMIENELTKTAKAEVVLDRLISSEGTVEELVGDDPFLNEYKFYLGEIFKQAKHRLSDDAEEMYVKMNLTGGSAWSKLFDYLTATLEVDYNGEKTNLSTIRGKATDPDREVRRQAYEAELAAYPKIADSVAFALNNIKSQVIMMARERGYESPLDQTLQESNMKRETLDAMLSAMVEYMPKFREYMRAKAHYIGAGERLAWYDIVAPLGKSLKKYTKEEAHKYLIESFSAFSADMAEMMDRAFKEEWIDFDPRPGKVGGAFCAGLLGHEQARILTNFDGSFDSVDTLAHELGHAYHDKHTDCHRPLNHDYCMQVAETASTFNETLIMKKAVAEAEGEEKLALLDSLLAGVNQTVVDIYSRYLFESEVFARCEEELLMPADLCDIMLRAQEKSYGDGLDPEKRHPYMWACKSHYYSEGLSFYNFPYAFGQLFAMGLYSQYEKEGASFVPKYQALLRATPVSTVEETAAMAGIDVTKKDFWEQSLQAFAKLIDEFIELTK